MTQGPDCDLHPYFRDPDKARAILDVCIADNVAQNRTLVRVVHGKGRGDFRELIQSHLRKHPDVEGFVLCDPFHGGSGATWVHLVQQNPPKPGIEPRPSVPTPRPLWRWPAYAALLAVLYYFGARWDILLLAAAALYVYEQAISKPRHD